MPPLVGTGAHSPAPFAGLPALGGKTKKFNAEQKAGGGLGVGIGYGRQVVGDRYHYFPHPRRGGSCPSGAPRGLRPCCGGCAGGPGTHKVPAASCALLPGSGPAAMGPLGGTRAPSESPTVDLARHKPINPGSLPQCCFSSRLSRDTGML